MANGPAYRVLHEGGERAAVVANKGSIIISIIPTLGGLIETYEYEALVFDGGDYFVHELHCHKQDHLRVIIHQLLDLDLG